MYFSPEESISIVEATKVKVLSKQFNRGLGAVGVQFGHIQIINEEHYTLVPWSTCSEKRGESKYNDIAETT